MAYAVKAATAKRLLELTHPLDYVLDGMLGHLIEEKKLKAYVVYPNLVETLGDVSLHAKGKIPSIIWATKS